jgi:integrase
MELVDQQLDPVGEARQRAARGARDALTFDNLVHDYIADQKRAGLTSAIEVERALKKDILPLLGHRRLSEIRSLEVQQAVDAVAARVQETRGERSSGEMARHCLRYIKQVFNHALFDNEELRTKYGLKENPAAVVGRSRRGKPGRYGKARVRERALGDVEIVAFWHATDQSDMSSMTKSLLKLLLLTGVRVSELRKAEIGELVLDGPAPVWKLPKERAKNRRAHAVPLTPLMLSLFHSAVGNRSSGPVFPSADTKDGFLGEYTARQAITRLLNGSRLAIPPFSPHDLRRTVDTGLARLGVPEDVQRHVLNHAPQGVTALHYNRHAYEVEKRDALEKWTAHIEKLIGAR